VSWYVLSAVPPCSSPTGSTVAVAALALMPLLVPVLIERGAAQIAELEDERQLLRDEMKQKDSLLVDRESQIKEVHTHVCPAQMLAITLPGSRWHSCACPRSCIDS
jgi:hypothetical protein